MHQPGSINLKVGKMISVKSTVFEFGKWMNFGFVFQFYRWAGRFCYTFSVYMPVQSSWNFCAVRNLPVRLNLFTQAYLAYSTIPGEKEDLLIDENVTRFLNECFLRTMKHEKSVMRTNIQDFRTISGTFLYPNPDCWFQKPILCSALQQSTNEVWI